MGDEPRTARQIEIDGAWHILFFDMAEAEETCNIEQIVDRATKHPANPILPLGHAREFDGLAACIWGGGGLLYDRDEELFRIWYHAHGREYHPDPQWRDEYSRRTSSTGYAFSPDGMNFTKPSLGLHNYAGRRDNNIVLPGRTCCPVFRDPTQPDPRKRYATFVAGDIGATPSDDWSWDLWYSPDGMQCRSTPHRATRVRGWGHSATGARSARRGSSLPSQAATGDIAPPGRIGGELLPGSTGRRATPSCARASVRIRRENAPTATCASARSMATGPGGVRCGSTWRSDDTGSGREERGSPRR